jgi:hypothetical protein
MISPPERRAGFFPDANVSKLMNKKNDSFTLIAGDDGIILASKTGRGLLYAVYTFLEQIGVRFYAPQFEFYGDHAEYVPTIRLLTVTPFERLEEPDLEFRRKYVEEGWSHTPSNLTQLIDWMAKKKLNTLVYPMDYQGQGLVKWDTWRKQLLPELKKRGMQLEVGGHGYQSFMPKEILEKEHPEWFHGPDEPVSGKQKRVNVFKITNEEALEAYVTRVTEYLSHYPEIDIFDGWPPDGATWSKNDVDALGGMANAQAYVANRLAERMASAVPHVKLEQLSYVPVVEPPDTNRMYQKDIIVDFALYDRSYSDSIYSKSCEANAKYDRNLAEWKTRGFQGHLCIYEYYTKYSWHSLPVLLPIQICDEIGYLSHYGMNGLGIYSEPANWLTYELIHTLIADLCWKVNIDGKEYLKNYCNDRYQAHVEELERYFENMEKAGKLYYDSPGGTKDSGKIENILSIYRETKQRLEQLSFETESAAAFLTKRLIWNLDYAVAATETHYARLTGQTIQYEQAKKLTKALVDARCFDGIILKSVYTQRITDDLSGIEGRKGLSWIYDMYRLKW